MSRANKHVTETVMNCTRIDHVGPLRTDVKVHNSNC